MYFSISLIYYNSSPSHHLIASLFHSIRSQPCFQSMAEVYQTVSWKKKWLLYINSWRWYICTLESGNTFSKNVTVLTSLIITRTKTSFITDGNEWLFATSKSSPCQEAFEAHRKRVINVKGKPNKINSFAAFSFPGGVWLQHTIDG